MQPLNSIAERFDAPSRPVTPAPEGSYTWRHGRRTLSSAAVTALLLCAAFLWSCAGTGEVGTPDRGDDWATVKEQGSGAITVLFVPSDGFAYEDEQGSITGLAVEIMKEFIIHAVREHGVHLTLEMVEEPDWRRFYDRVRNARGGVFGLGNVTITEERKEEIGFSPPYLTNVAVLISHADIPELDDLQQIPVTFQGHTALAFEGTLHETRIRSLQAEYAPGMAMEMAHSTGEIIQRVSSAPGYFGYVDIHEYWLAAQEGLPVRRHAVGDDATEEFGIIMPRDSDWQPVLEDFFQADGGFRETEIYRDLIRLHLGEEMLQMLDQALRETEPQAE